MKKIFICALGSACMAVACNSLTEDAPVQYGEIAVALGEPEVEVITKAEVLGQDDPSAADYTVSIYNSDNVFQYGATYDKLQSQKLELGTYYVTAENCTEAEADSYDSNKGRMRIAGRSADIVLDADHLSQTATVACEVANARVAVEFDESVSGRFSDLKVVLSGSKTVTVNETAAGVETETWFNPQTLTYTISGVFTQFGKEIRIEDTKELAARNNVKIYVRLNLSEGQVVPEITINSTIDNVEEIPGEFNPYN